VRQSIFFSENPGAPSLVKETQLKGSLPITSDVLPGMRVRPNGKDLPTTEGKSSNKKAFIIKYRTNNPQSDASEIAQKIGTSVGYVWKVLSQARKTSTVIRGRNGRIFAHGKVYYEWNVMPESVAKLTAPVINLKTGMKQIGCIKDGHPCSCQIHPNGHLIVWSRSVGWREWLTEELTVFGWNRELAQFIVDQLRLNVNVAECGVKPVDPGFLPKELCLETDWGLVVVRDDTPEKGVLELKLSIPDLKRYLGFPEIKKTLEVIEQGSLTHNQSHKTIEALLISLYRVLQAQDRIPKPKEEETN